MQNFQFSKGLEISGIKGFSFQIPELIKWLGMKTVSYASTEQGGLGAMELSMEPVVLKEENPHIEIRLESKTFNTSIRMDDSIEITVKNAPRIYIDYNETKELTSVELEQETLCPHMPWMGLHCQDTWITRPVKIDTILEDMGETLNPVVKE